jgi:integrase
MAKPASLEPRHSSAREALGKAPWFILVPPDLSPTGKEQRLFFPTKKAAALDAAKLQHRQESFGSSLSCLTPARMAEAAEAYTLIDPFGYRLLDVIRTGLNVYQSRSASIAFLDLYNRFLSLKERAPEYESELRWIRDRFPQLHHRLVCDITHEDLEKILKPLTPGARNPIMRYWRAVFNLGKKGNYLAENPVDRLTFTTPRRKEVQIIDNAHAQKMLTHALEHNLDLLPYLVLGFFCGIRPQGELQKLLWSDIHLADRTIVIRAEVSKTHRRRFPELSDNAVSWFTAYQVRGGETKGAIVPFSSRQLYTHRVANWTVAGLEKWIPQGMRHTFCSNWLAKHKDVNKLVLLSGHDSVDTMWRHYFKGTTEADAGEFWSIRPSAGTENIVRFSVNAAG